MIDIKLIRENKDLVKENIKKKFQDEKLELVDKVYEKDIKNRELKVKGDNLRAEKNQISALIGQYMREKNIEKADEAKRKVNEINNSTFVIKNFLNKTNNLINNARNLKEILRHSSHLS